MCDRLHRARSVQSRASPYLFVLPSNESTIPKADCVSKSGVQISRVRDGSISPVFAGLLSIDNRMGALLVAHVESNP